MKYRTSTVGEGQRERTRQRKRVHRKRSRGAIARVRERGSRPEFPAETSKYMELEIFQMGGRPVEPIQIKYTVTSTAVKCNQTITVHTSSTNPVSTATDRKILGYIQYRTGR